MENILKTVIVDDEQVHRYMLYSMLTDWGWSCQEADDGEAAVERMGDVRLHLIDQADHCPQIDKPEEFNATVLDFLRD